MNTRARGQLKNELMRILWAAEAPLTAKEMQTRFNPEEPVPALTTVLTVLDRLRGSGLVERTPNPPGEAVFAASAPESQFTADAMLAALLESHDSPAALLRFAGELDDTHLALLRDALKTRRRKKQ